MGVRRNFRRRRPASPKKGPQIEKKIAEKPTIRRKCVKKANKWRKVAKKPPYIAEKIVSDFPGGRTPTLAPSPCGRPYAIIYYKK